MKIGPSQIKYNKDKTSFIEDPANTHFFVYFAQTTKANELIEVRKLLKRNNITLIKYPKEGCHLSILNILPANNKAVLLTYNNPTTGIYIGALKQQFIDIPSLPFLKKENVLLKIHSLYTKPLTLAYSFSPGQYFLTEDRCNTFFDNPPYEDVFYPPWFKWTYKWFEELPYLNLP